jgi:[ribosomal protein S5]-alanine N-acetyltransferase
MFPQLESTRFLLREIEPDDQVFVFEGLSHPQVVPYYGVSYDSFEATKNQMEFYENIWKEGTGAWWKIVDKETGSKVGAIGYNYYSSTHNKAEIGYWLLPTFWKKGIVKEVLPITIEYMQKVRNIHRIEALVEDDNRSSCSVLEKAGFVYEGTMRECEMKDGKYISLCIYSLLSEK